MFLVENIGLSLRDAGSTIQLLGSGNNGAGLGPGQLLHKRSSGLGGDVDAPDLVVVQSLSRGACGTQQRRHRLRHHRDLVRV